MSLNQDIISFTNHMVDVCEIDSASIMLCNTSDRENSLSYLYNTGLRSDFLFRYRKEQIFLKDPFLSEYGSKSGYSFWPWNFDLENDPAALDYHHLIGKFSIAPVGASIVSINPGLSLIVGTHCRTGRHSRRDVTIPKLEQHVRQLSNMVIHDLLSTMTGHPQGLKILKHACHEGGAPNQVPELSIREAEIAGMICLGMRNKEIGARLGLSEHTVENHLRNIYAKFEINNRASLVSKISGLI